MDPIGIADRFAVPSSGLSRPRRESVSQVVSLRIAYWTHGENGMACKLLIALASQRVPTWNRIVSWLKEMETLSQKCRLIA